MSRFSFIGRHRDQSETTQSEPGHVRFDELGNPVYHWHDESQNTAEALGERAKRTEQLVNPTLSLVDDSAEYEYQLVNASGMRMGYNPYESGCLIRTKKEKKPTDLRELSRWIEQTRVLDRKLDKLLLSKKK